MLNSVPLTRLHRDATLSHERRDEIPEQTHSRLPVFPTAVIQNEVNRPLRTRTASSVWGGRLQAVVYTIRRHLFAGTGAGSIRSLLSSCVRNPESASGASRISRIAALAMASLKSNPSCKDGGN